MNARSSSETPFSQALQALANPGKLHIIWHLRHYTPLRYGTLHGLVPELDDKKLSRLLKEMTEDRLLYRTEDPQNSRRIEYTVPPTPFGRRLVAVAESLHEWSELF